MDLSFQISLPISHTIFSSDKHLLLSNQSNTHQTNQTDRKLHKVEDEISIELVNENHKSDQIITHHPKSYHKIGEIKSEIK